MTGKISKCDNNAKEKSIIIKPTEKRLTLEKIFADWDGTPYDSYDWGELDKPVGRELL